MYNIQVADTVDTLHILVLTWSWQICKIVLNRSMPKLCKGPSKNVYVLTSVQNSHSFRSFPFKKCTHQHLFKVNNCHKNNKNVPKILKVYRNQQVYRNQYLFAKYLFHPPASVCFVYWYFWMVPKSYHLFIRRTSLEITEILSNTDHLGLKMETILKGW